SAFGAVYNVDANGVDTAHTPGLTAVLYTGQVWDAESGLYNYRNRYYHPGLGRFLARDPAGYGDGMNLYAYVRNNPLRYTDPDGLTSRSSLLGTSIGGSLGSGFTPATAMPSSSGSSSWASGGITSTANKAWNSVTSAVSWAGNGISSAANAVGSVAVAAADHVNTLGGQLNALAWTGEWMDAGIVKQAGGTALDFTKEVGAVAVKSSTIAANTFTLGLNDYLNSHSQTYISQAQTSGDSWSAVGHGFAKFSGATGLVASAIGGGTALGIGRAVMATPTGAAFVQGASAVAPYAMAAVGGYQLGQGYSAYRQGDYTSATFNTLNAGAMLWGVGQMAGAQAPSSGGLVHLTNGKAGALINESEVLRGNIYAGPLSNAGQSGLGVTLRTGLSPGAYEAAVRIPSAGEAAFSSVRPIGPMTTWQWLTGQQYTANGVLNLSTGAFTRTGVNWNQVLIYGTDAAITVGTGYGIYRIATPPSSGGGN
ncbi:MAG: RHS repeat-associated core domain-containing protein, partial [Phycisphaerae bacterium]